MHDDRSRDAWNIGPVEPTQARDRGLSGSEVTPTTVSIGRPTSPDLENDASHARASFRREPRPLAKTLTHPSTPVEQTCGRPA